jgi:ATP-dependent Clp protease adaptor protein ClpS
MVGEEGSRLHAARLGENDAVTAPDITTVERPESAELVLPEVPWVTIVWDDPVNLMSYVTFVFIDYFHYAKSKARKLMMQVHNDGKAVVSSGSREEMERDVQAMHSYGLWATLQKGDA